MSLILQSDVEARLGRSLTGEEVTAFNVINPALQSYVERMIGSSVESVSATTRYYNGGVQHLDIDPCTNITAVKQYDDDFTAIYTYDSTDYVAEPINDTLKNMIIHRVGFITGIKNIGVTAKFSIYADTDVLNIVKNAMIEFLVSEIENSENIKRESIEGYSVEFATSEAKNTLQSIEYLFPEV